MTLMELGRRINANEITLEDALLEMKEGSTSVLLNWSEDDGELWECSWIVGDKLYTAHHPQPRSAMLAAVVNCISDLVGKVPHKPLGGFGCPDRDDGRHCSEHPEHENCFTCCYCGEKATVVHGQTCPKVPHTKSGMLHDESDDRPYDVDGVNYCGRCHVAL